MKRGTPSVRGRAGSPHGHPSQLAVASALAAVLTWVLQAGAGRILGPDAYAAFMVVWGFVFLEIGMLLGLQQEVTRAVASEQEDEVSAQVRPMTLGLALGLAGAALVFGSSPAWGLHLFGSHWVPVTVATAFGFLAYSLFNVMNGVLAGRQLWTDYSMSIATDAVLRLLLVIPAMVLATGLGGQAWALNGAALTWVVLLGRRGFREALRARVSLTHARMARGAGHAMAANGCSAMMVAGYPVLLQLTTREPLGREAGVVLAAVIATRAPLLLPLNAFQAVILTRFVLARRQLGHMVSRLLAVVAGVTGLGVAAGYLIGPFMLQLLYGAEFKISSTLIALLILAAGLIAMQSLTGSAVMSLGRHGVFAGSWLLSATVTAFILTVDLSVGTRSALALNLGPVAGLTVNLAALARLRGGHS